MDLFSFGAGIVTAVTAVAMLILNNYGYAYDSAQMHLLMGCVMIPLSLVLDRMRLKPIFIFAPMWALGFIPLISGLYRLGSWQLLLAAIPAVLFCQWFLKEEKKERIHHAIDVTHELLKTDPDKLRREIEENREHLHHENHQR